MDEELLRLLRGYHVSTQGLKILDDVGVVGASDFMHINEFDLARCGMNLEDRDKVGMIRQQQLINFRDGRGRGVNEKGGGGSGVKGGGAEEETFGRGRNVWGTEVTGGMLVQMSSFPANSSADCKNFADCRFDLLCACTHTQ